MTDRVTVPLDNDDYVIYIFLDFAEVYDPVNHSILSYATCQIKLICVIRRCLLWYKFDSLWCSPWGSTWTVVVLDLHK